MPLLVSGLLVLFRGSAFQSFLCKMRKTRSHQANRSSVSLAYTGFKQLTFTHSWHRTLSKVPTVNARANFQNAGILPRNPTYV
ncbi:hypothetical protein F5Y18DRAFT_395610 [Xylariaceae sp. FL1019]|nr:hypothetical protein F5Y18DRAFT_395610 [Xylariaceae sp. FL1019]